MKAAEWREWLRQVQVDLGARLAETIGERPSPDPEVRALVTQVIQLEAALAVELES